MVVEGGGGGVQEQTHDFKIKKRMAEKRKRTIRNCKTTINCQWAAEVFASLSLHRDKRREMKGRETERIESKRRVQKQGRTRDNRKEMTRK